jgi:hypothetical protein
MYSARWWAEYITDMCDRFHVLPSAVLAEDSRIMGMILMADERRTRGEADVDLSDDTADFDWG